jgi:hypothetical protein
VASRGIQPTPPTRLMCSLFGLLKRLPFRPLKEQIVIQARKMMLK